MLLSSRYNVLKSLGKGGCAETFLAEDTHLPSKRKCVVKQLKPAIGDPATYDLVKERFKKEAEILEAVGDHDQIPQLYAFFEDAGETYLVEQWFDGLTLTQKVARDGVSDDDFVRDFLVCILPIISFLHGKGIIHRDIKPDNIILREPDGMPVLIDFGTVKDKEATVLNLAVGSPSMMVTSRGYTAPEQAAGFPVEASDLFSLGMTAIFILTGKNPSSLKSSNGRVLWYPSVPNNNYMDVKLTQTIHKAIEPLVSDRFQDAMKMRESVYYGKRTDCQRFDAPVYTPYMWKALGDFGLGGGLSTFDDSMKLYPPDSDIYMRGLMWKVI